MSHSVDLSMKRKVRGTEQESFDNNDLMLCFPLMSLVRPWCPNSCASSLSWIDNKGSTREFSSLSHAAKPKSPLRTWSSYRCLHLKAFTVILHCQLYTTFSFTEAQMNKFASLCLAALFSASCNTLKIMILRDSGTSFSSMLLWLVCYSTGFLLMRFRMILLNLK